MGDAATTTPVAEHASGGRCGSREPSERGEVLHALRLGWYVAEVRGRVWWRGNRPAGEPMPPDPDRPLPLRPQRSALEAREQAVETLVALAGLLGVAAPEEPPKQSGPYAPRLRDLLATLDAVPTGHPDSAAALDQAWRPIAELLYVWDTAIQDQLTSRADIVACAYLLGRGLAECYWALGPDDGQFCADGRTPSGASWTFLFSPERRRELTRMAGRIGPYVDRLTPVAVSGSLEAWACVATDPAWRGEPSTLPALYEQSRRWYQLLVLGQDPSTLVKPAALLHSKRTTLRLARAFWPQLLSGVLSLAVVAAFLLLLTTGVGGPAVTTVLGLIGTVGLSASTLVATAKNATQSLLTRLRQSAYSDLVAMEVTCVPPHPDDLHQPKGGGAPVTHRKVERAVGARTIAVPLGTNLA